MKEAPIKKEIEDWLDAHGFVWSRNNPVRITKMGFAKIRPSQVGMPDLFIFPNFGEYKFLAVEAKATNAPKMAPKAQRCWKAKIIAVGGIHVFARSLRDVGRALKKDKSILDRNG